MQGFIQKMQTKFKHSDYPIFSIILMAIAGLLVARVSLFSTLFVFSVAFYSVFISNKSANLLVLLGCLLGLMSLDTFFFTSKYMILLCMLGGLHIWCISKDKRIKPLGQAMLSSLLFLLVNIIYTLFIHYSTTNLLLGVLEAGVNFILVYILSYFTAALQKRGTKKEIRQEEIIATVIVLSLIVVGTGQLYVGGLEVFRVLSYGLILIVSFYYGVATASILGVVLGILVNITVFEEPLLITTLALSGLLGGVFKDMGKWASALAFTLGNFTFYLYFQNEGLFMNLLLPILIADGIFILIPSSLAESFTGFINPKKKAIDDKEYINRVQSITMERLGSFSQTFNQLASTFESISEKQMDLSKGDVSKLMDDVAEQVCKYCQNVDHCWNKNFYSTYQTIYSILNAADEKGAIEFKDIPAGFYKQCYKYKEFIKVTNKLYEIYRINLNWYNKVMDSRQIVSNQLKGVSSVMENLSRDIKRDIQFELSVEEDVRVALEGYGIFPEEILTYKDHHSGYNMDITLSKMYDNNKIKGKIKVIVEENLGKPCRLDRQYMVDKHSLKLLYKERNMFKMSTGIAAKSKENLSGDNYTCSEIAMGRYLLALSDGMGTGMQANQDSVTTIELLEELLTTGFDNTTAVKMINSLLILKSIEDSFSTLDIALVNLQTGLCQLIKIGGAMVFVVRQERILAYESSTVPVGIVDKVELQTYDIQLKHGDILIMMTDGVVDAIEKIDDNREELLGHMLESCTTKNPKQIANKLMENIIQLRGGKIEDDMTLVVGRIWKERE